MSDEIIKIVRGKRNFTIVPNDAARDDSLSLKAKGLLLVLLSLNPKHGISIKKSMQFSKGSKDIHYSARKELINAGYLECTRISTLSGVPTYHYTVFESLTLREVPSPENPNPENPNPENPNPENPDCPSPENPNPENPELKKTIFYKDDKTKESPSPSLEYVERIRGVMVKAKLPEHYHSVYIRAAEKRIASGIGITLVLNNIMYCSTAWIPDRPGMVGLAIDRDYAGSKGYTEASWRGDLAKKEQPAYSPTIFEPADNTEAVKAIQARDDIRASFLALPDSDRDKLRDEYLSEAGRAADRDRRRPVEKSARFLSWLKERPTDANT